MEIINDIGKICFDRIVGWKPDVHWFIKEWKLWKWRGKISVNAILLKNVHVKLNRGRGEILETEVVSKECVNSNIVDVILCKLMVIIQTRRKCCEVNDG